MLKNYFAVLSLTAGVALAYEEPMFEAVYNTDIYDIRYYQERVVVETQSTEENNGFKTLFRYISGDNETADEIAMTIPVTQSKQENSLRFFLPKQYSYDTAPAPKNPQITIKQLPAEHLAVITYSGFASDHNFEKHVAKLKEALKKDGIKILGEPIKATYNSPFTLPFLRRNEAMIQVDWQEN